MDVLTLNDVRNTSLQMASMEQKKADKNVLRLVEEQKREKEEALSKILQLEKQLNAKQKLEMEIEELKGKMQVMKHLGDEDDAIVQNKMKEMTEELEEKFGEMDDLEALNQTIIVKERQSNDKLQEARKELIALLNVYAPKYETSGKFWPIVHNSTIFSLVLMQIIEIGIFVLKKLPLASILTIPLPVLTLLFNEYCRKRFLPIFKSYFAEGQNGSHFEHKPVPPPLPNKCDWEIEPSELDFSNSNMIGKGSFGEILIASWRGTPVAVKRILPSLSDDRLVIQDFRHEVILLVKLRHPNIVQFLGAVTERKPLMLITEYLRGGNLHQHLKEKGALNPATAVNFALDIARGMAYLHNEPNVIIHRDLKPK